MCVCVYVCACVCMCVCVCVCVCARTPPQSHRGLASLHALKARTLTTLHPHHTTQVTQAHNFQSLSLLLSTSPFTRFVSYPTTRGCIFYHFTSLHFILFIRDKHRGFDKYFSQPIPSQIVNGIERSISRPSAREHFLTLHIYILEYIISTLVLATWYVLKNKYIITGAKINGRDDVFWQ